MDLRPRHYAEDEFLPEAELFAATPSRDASRERMRERIAYGVIGVSALLLSGLAGFLIADYSRGPAAPNRVVQQTPAAPQSVPPAPQSALAAEVETPGVAAQGTATVERPVLSRRRPVLSTGDLSGWWSVTNRVESSGAQPAGDVNLGYRVLLTQTGSQISGSGHKWMENGRPLPPSEQTAIAVDGTVDGHEVQLHFIEHGPERESSGTFTYEIADGDLMQGRFSSEAGESAGSTQARRMLTPE